MQIKNKKSAFSILELSIVILIIAATVSAIVVKRANFFEKANSNKIISATKNSVLKDMEGLAVWYEVATDESFKKSEIVENGDITQWKNIAPDNYLDMNLEESTNPPSYAIDEDDGLPMLSFTASFDALTSDRSVYGYELAKKDQITIFAVNKYASGAGHVFDWGVPYSNRILLHARYSDGRYYFDVGHENTGGRISTSSLTTYDNQWKIVTAVRRSDGSSYISLNNSANIATSSTMTDDFDVTTSDTFFIGFDSFDVRELIVFKRALTEQEIADVEEYLSKKWNIELD